MSVTLAIIALAIPLIFIYYLKNAHKHYKLPPGPSGLPLVGNLLQILPNPHLKLSELANRYGRLFSIRLGPKQILVVNELATMKEIFGTMESTGRAENINILNATNWGINSEGELWQEQRRFCLKAIKDLGFRSQSFLDCLIIEKVHEVCEFINQKIQTGQNENLDFSKILLQTTANTVWTFVTGERISSINCKIADVLEQWFEALNLAGKRGLIFVPSLKYIAPKLSGHNFYVKANHDLYKLISGYVEKLKEFRLKSKEERYSEPTNMISAYLEQIEKTCDPSDSFYGIKGENHCIHSVSLLLLGGADTVMSTLQWFICYMVAFPHVLKKAQQEIDDVIGTDRDPVLADRQRMPYFDALILETLRFSSFAPFGVIHKLCDDVSYQDYTIPKGTLLMANVYHANRDPQVWLEPNKFLPERFLVDEAERRVLKNHLSTFQHGKRKCPGEKMANDMLFLFTSMLVQRYDFLSKEGVSKEEYIKPTVTYLLIPPALGVTAKPRFEK